MIGREIDMYRVMQMLKPLGKLIKIKGGAGFGARSIAKAVARYVSTRKLSFDIDEVIWLPFWQVPDDDSFLCALKGLSDLFGAEKECLSKSSEYDRLWTHVCRSLDEKNALVVIDPQFVQENGFISSFLNDIFDKIGEEFVSVMLICEDGFDVSAVKKCSEAEITVDPLDFRSTALLFGRICRFVTMGRNERVCTPTKFACLIAPEDADLSQREGKAFKLWRAIGEGIPADVHAAAKAITAAEFDDLVKFAQRPAAEARNMSPIFSLGKAELESQSNDQLIPALHSLEHTNAISSSANSSSLPDVQMTDLPDVQ